MSDENDRTSAGVPWSEVVFRLALAVKPSTRVLSRP
jgi:hypothetical protein